MKIEPESPCKKCYRSAGCTTQYETCLKFKFWIRSVFHVCRKLCGIEDEFYPEDYGIEDDEK